MGLKMTAKRNPQCMAKRMSGANPIVAALSARIADLRPIPRISINIHFMIFRRRFRPSLLASLLFARPTYPISNRNISQAHRWGDLDMHAARKAKPDLHTFEGISLDELESLGSDGVDRLPFGVVGMTAAGEVKVFNAAESRLARLAAQEVLGSQFFEDFGRCMNNQRVAGLFNRESDLDVILDHVLTFRMKITPARLRLLCGRGAKLKYLLVQR